ncbi:urease accessory protein UreE [Sinisalibacter lacisalsi]|uniref:Urease accessory protein UreE n=1 Tax=Sinisalibacter lacisalsi TaxID=1526570 RepID=A0ABQ1QPM6_9RHOB|nr:urease accessory protein UreE [Sinisalibacter lacisalsi]GGD36116.1 urease accessory protein UreE [Sinisalibacter lacisalsi]
MTDLPISRSLLKHPPGQAVDHVVLDYDQRLLRRRRLVTKGGLAFLADLPEVTNLDDHWGFQLEDGRAIGVEPAPEDLVEVTGDLARLAWHIGNRHTPCEIGAAALRIRRDHVIEAMLAQLGARLRPVTGPFRPEGGAYGAGRTMGHDHHHDHSHA